MLSMTIGGRPATTSRSFDVVNPATGEVEAQAPDCTSEQLDQAMESAATAYRAWRLDEGARRAALHALADAVDQHRGELAQLLILETGKPTWLAEAEVDSAGPWLRYYADLDMPREIVQDDATALVEVAHRPLGVVAAITPWNGPVGLWSWKVGPALRAGNTVVIKPSPYTPLSTLRLGQIAAAVLPAGVINVVTGGDDLGAAMTGHPIPRKISFTGSISAGRSVALAGAADFKRVTLELGGNDAAIILDDVDIDAAVAALLPVSLLNAGQICCIPKRIFAPTRLYPQIVDAFAAAADSIVVGSPTDAGTQMGPLSTRPQYERISELVAEAISGGARVAAGGHQIEGGGYFFQPTVLADLAEGVRIVDEEQFGPAIPMLSYDDVDEAIARANDTNYGLSGSVWSADSDRAAAVAEQLECGTTYVNTHAILPPHIPFSGSKWSGLGVANGVDGLISFTEPQVVHRARKSS